MDTQKLVSENVPSYSAHSTPSDALLLQLCPEIANLVPVHTYPPDVELLRQDTRPQEVFCVKSGIVKLTRIEMNGRELIVDLCFPGRLLGIASAIVDAPHPVTATTVTTCSLRRIPVQQFRELLKAKPSLSWYLHQMQSHDALDHVARLAQLGCCTARDRLEHLLCRLLEAQEQNFNGRETRLQLPLRHWEVAELIATTPPYLCRLFKEMEVDGVVQRRKGWLVVRDPRSLVNRLREARDRRTDPDLAPSAPRNGFGVRGVVPFT